MIEKCWKKNSSTSTIKLTRNNMLDNYTYFHTNQRQVLVFHKAHWDMAQLCIPSFRLTSLHDSKIFTIAHSFVSCMTFLGTLPKFLMAVSTWCLDSFRQFTLYPCRQFSAWVHHSKLSSLLSSRIPFLWFTKGLFSGFGTYTKAMSLWTKKCLWPIVVTMYQNLDFVTVRNRHSCHQLHHFAWLQGLKSSVIAYLPSIHGISFIKVIKKIVYRMRYSTLGTLSSVCCNIQDNYSYLFHNTNKNYG